MRPHAIIAALCALGALSGGCPPSGALRSAASGSGSLPRVLWSVQIDGNPWPLGRRGDHVYVWSLRRAPKGFLFPIRLLARDPRSGQSQWRVPIRPWLRTRGVLQSVVVARARSTLGAWVKGDVIRAIREADGEDAWSLPRGSGITSHGATYVIPVGRELRYLDPRDGRERARIPLPAPASKQLLHTAGTLLLQIGPDEVLAMDLARRRIAWRKHMGWLAHPPAGPPQTASGNALFAVWRSSAAGQVADLYALRLQSGTLAWRVSLPTPQREARKEAALAWRATEDLILWPAPKAGCVWGLDAATGRRRFRTCGLSLSSLPVRVGDRLYALGANARASEALAQGLAWYAVDYPLISLDVKTGKARPLLKPLGRRQRRVRAVPIRTLRLPLAPRSKAVLYLLGRDRFLTALQVAQSKDTP